MKKADKEDNVAPFLRWAGGKRWLVKHLDQIIGTIEYKNYFEPFLGSGAVFFALSPKNKVFLSDLNQELIDTYFALQTDPNSIIENMEHFENTKEFYYYMRNYEAMNIADKASRFIYLNQTSYNGIYRVNLKGKYNVPYGYREKCFLEKNNLYEASKKLQGASLACADFSAIIPHIKEHDLIFLDPPYTVSHNNNGFIKYNQKLFSLEDQKRLSSLIDVLRDKKAYYILTNAAHKTILDIFEKGDRRLELSRASLIGGENAKRGSVTEYIFTNIPEG